MSKPVEKKSKLCSWTVEYYDWKFKTWVVYAIRRTRQEARLEAQSTLFRTRIRKHVTTKLTIGGKTVRKYQITS